MAQHTDVLSRLSTGGYLFLTDGGIETTLIFHEGLELPDFAAFTLLRTPEGTAALSRYYQVYADLAVRHGTGLVLESATWRANPDWGARLGYGPEELAEANRRAVDLLEGIRGTLPGTVPAVISGCIGPRGDGYVPSAVMTADQARDYHAAQVTVFSETAADLVTAITMNYVEEAIGVARAAETAGIPAVLSFTVETDGRLPTGDTLQAAIESVDQATDSYPSWYMVNCAHPDHIAPALEDGGAWLARLGGLRANASRKSHAELNDATELDIGDPEELGAQYAGLLGLLPRLTVVGGCCGTDHRHVDRIAAACLPLFPAVRGT